MLYTSGGRVPGDLLSTSPSRMIHIHPGVVPYVRGSDCLFWSVLTRGRPGMSCFYMNAGIDTGDIIHTREFDAPSYPVSRTVFRYRK
jgi:methionyl-tRNA formyltransferase